MIQAALLKLYPSKPYTCDFCQDSKKSALGFLTHKVTCNKTQEQIEELKLSCDLCDRRLLPHQIVDHDKYHRKMTLQRAKSNKPDSDNSVAKADGTPSRRAAALKASEMIKQVTTTELSTTEGNAQIPFKILVCLI